MKAQLNRRRSSGGTVALLLGAVALFATVHPVAASQIGRLFPTDLPQLEWSTFKADGFSKPAAGILFGSENPACCGVALGGIGTGCLDIETGGVLGFDAMFNMPGEPRDRVPQLLLPFLGMSVGNDVWVLSDKKYIDGGNITGCYEIWDPLFRDIKGRGERWSSIVPKIEGVRAAKRISYWGHYPVADLEYETDAPVSVGLRAWSPFIPGDIIDSNTPGAVFEVRLRNTTSVAQKGMLAFSFPGPNWMVDEYAKRKALPVAAGPDWILADYGNFVGSAVSGVGVRGVEISSVGRRKVSYVLGVIGEANVRVGKGLASDSGAWSKIASELPAIGDSKTPSRDTSSSVSVDFTLKPNQSKTIRFVLAWYSPYWKGRDYEQVGGFDHELPRWSPDPQQSKNKRESYVAAYADRFVDALAVADKLSREHGPLLKRVLAWQQAVYTDERIPVWLRDCLVNNLALIPECSYWARPMPAVDKWAAPLGAFGLDESPRGCTIMGCITSNWYGDLPITYFFPELDRQLLRDYAAYQRPDGAAPFLFPPGDFTIPTYTHQIALNGSCFTELVNRLWLRTGNDAVVKEFYPAVKKNVVFTMTQKKGPHAVISAYNTDLGQEWWEHTPVQGMVTHLGIMHLAQLKIAERMAKKMGDEEFAKQCRDWFSEGSQELEKYLWAGDYYVFFNDPERDKRSDLIMSSQLDGDWAAYLNGFEGVVPADRAKTALAKIAKTCVVGCGLVGFADPKTGVLPLEYGTFPPELNIVGMTYMYRGETKQGMDIIWRTMDNLVRKQRHPWDLPNLIRCDTGAVTFGTDYYQNMALWAAPAAIAGADLSGPCKKGGLVDRMIRAGRAPKAKSGGASLGLYFDNYGWGGGVSVGDARIFRPL